MEEHKWLTEKDVQSLARALAGLRLRRKAQNLAPPLRRLIADWREMRKLCQRTEGEDRLSVGLRDDICDMLEATNAKP